MRKSEIVKRLLSAKNDIDALLWELDVCTAKGCDMSAETSCESCEKRLCYEHSTPDAEGECRFCQQCADAWIAAEAMGDGE